ncbi:MAG: 1,2-phenylacetyl-CoA epoxidase subunit PaaB [Gemmatirosa sp.]
MYGTVLPVGDAAGQEQDAAPSPATGAPTEGAVADGQWQLWEVFTQEAQGAPHEHAGSVRATDAGHALQNARDVYGRRGKVISMWVVPTGAIAATSPSDAGPYFDPMNERPYVHPHFYKAPRGVRGV